MPFARCVLNIDNAVNAIEVLSKVCCINIKDSRRIADKLMKTTHKFEDIQKMCWLPGAVLLIFTPRLVTSFSLVIYQYRSDKDQFLT
jgi:hypothetical protein